MTALPVARVSTRYPSTIRVAPSVPFKSTGLRVLKSAAGNAKLTGKSNMLERGPFRGLPLFTLTLTERDTCPASCPHWGDCYGDNMRYAARHETGPELLDSIGADLDVLDRRHGAFALRLHVLGDFFSTGYVAFWARQLDAHHGLHVYGYTHRAHGDPIGAAVASLRGPRWRIMRSDPTDASDPLPGAYSSRVKMPRGAPYTGPRPDDIPDGPVLCPEQTGKTDSCSTCGLCMNGRTSVAFLSH